MFMILYEKFQQNPELKEKLINTDRKALVEGNTWRDYYWGMNSDLTKGKNYLGICLMLLRRDFIAWMQKIR